MGAVSAEAAQAREPAALERRTVIVTRWILILSLLAVGLYILGNIVYFAGATFIPLGEEFAIFNHIMGYTVLIPAFVALGAWLLGIVDTLRRGLWGWCVLVVLVPVLGSLIYSAVTLSARQTQVA
jgi:hypothetical protein